MKKNKKGGITARIIIFIILLAALLTGGVVFIINSGIFKNPRKAFAENVVGVSKNINKEISNIGSIPMDALVHFGIDDTDKSHTCTRTTRFSSDTMPAYDLVLEQTYSYNADNGDAAYDITASVSGNPLGTGSMYFSGDQFIFVPMDPGSPMIRYQMDSSAQESLKNVGAIERYAKMIMESDKREETDWDQELNNFIETALSGLTEKDFIKSKAGYTILGEEKECNTVSLTVSDDNAVNLISGLSDLIYKEIIDLDENDINKFNSLIDTYTQNDGDMEITMTTYSYKGTPVAIIADVTLDQETCKYEINYYKKGSEKQMIIDCDSTGGDSYYEESVICTGSGKYSMTNKCDFDGFFVTILQEVNQSGSSKDLNGTFEISSNKPSSDDITSITGNFMTGTIKETSVLGNGTKTTTLKSDKVSVDITSYMTRGPLETNKITPPVFLPESGIDCETNLEDLKAALDTGDTLKVNMDNSVYSLAQVFILMIKKAGILDLL